MTGNKRNIKIKNKYQVINKQVTSWINKQI